MLKKIEEKELINEIGTYYSVPMIWDTDTKSYYISKTVSPLSTENLISLLRNKDKIVDLSDDAEKSIRVDNDIKIWDNLYVINSSILNESISDLFSNQQNSASGRAGNLSASYHTPYYNELCRNELQKMGVNMKSKILSSAQYKIIQKARCKIIFEDDESNYELDVTDFSKEQFDSILMKCIDDGYRPVRILFDGVRPELVSLFNLKPINTMFSEIYRKEVERYFEIKNCEVEVVTSKELLEKYKVDIKKCFKTEITNEQFYLRKANGVPSEIYVINKHNLYYGYISDSSKRAEFNHTSFIRNKKHLKDNVSSIQVEGESRRIEIVEKSIEDILEFNNYKGLQDLNKRRPEKVNFYDWLIHTHKKDIRDRINKIAYSLMIYSDNKEDDLIKKTLVEKLHNSKYFQLTRVAHKHKNGGVSNLEDYNASIKQFGVDNNVKFYLYTRKQQIPLENASNMSFFNLHKSNLSFEREKSLSLLFIDDKIEKLRAEGHENIEVYLETPTEKCDGKDGYLDLIIMSKKEQVKYGQAYELKAYWYYGDTQQNALVGQCDEYDVKDIMISRGVEKTYDDIPLNQVKGVNLKIDDYVVKSVQTIAKKRKNSP